MIQSKLLLSLTALTCIGSAFAQTTPGDPPPPPGPVDTCKPVNETKPKFKADGTKIGFVTIKKTTTATIAMNKGPVGCVEVPPCSGGSITQPATEWKEQKYRLMPRDGRGMAATGLTQNRRRRDVKAVPEEAQRHNSVSHWSLQVDGSRFSVIRKRS